MPRERNADEEAGRNARTPYDILRYRLEKLQENPISWCLVIIQHLLDFGQIGSTSRKT
jgi:hypothetical protein